MKKLIYLSFAIFTFFLISDHASALTWQNYTWSAIRPTNTSFYEFCDASTSGCFEEGAALSVTAWGFPGFAIFKPYDYAGVSFENIPSRISWYYQNVQWCKGQSFTLTGQIFSTYDAGYNFFSDRGIKVSLETDTQTISCTTSPGSYNSNGLNYVDFVCSGSASNSFRIILDFYLLVPMTNNFMIRSDYSNIACDYSTTDLHNSLIESQKQLMENQNQNKQDIVDNQNQNKQEIIDNQNKNQAQTNQKLDDLNQSITDDSAPDLDNVFGDIQLDTDSAVSDLILLPITFLQRILNLSSGTCSDYTLDFGIFGSDYDLKLPCIDLESFFGSRWWSTIDYLFCFFMIYEIIMLAISAFEDFTSLRDTYDGLYQPKHASTGYQPKHAKE